jgi:hypothetical protein
VPDLTITALLLIDEVGVNTIIRVLPFFAALVWDGRVKCCASGLNAGDFKTPSKVFAAALSC